MSALILIIEDEPDLASTLEYNLQREGYDTFHAPTGAAGLARLNIDPLPELVLLDLMLPDLAGTEVCRQIRQEERTRGVPVIMLTAKSEEIDRVVGFEVGADDYVTKPFSVRELLLRIQAVLRRLKTSEKGGAVLTNGELRVDPEAHRVWISGEEVSLTALEFRLLHTFLQRKGRVQTRERLLDDVWGIRAEVTTRTVDTHVKRLRQKIGAAGRFIQTIRGVGYRFTDGEED
ncbi:MAG: winged helix-turn-helix domain-containing protein [Bradymonadia bacterium]